LTWKLVANELRQRGWVVILPSLKDEPDLKHPYWQQHSLSVAQALADVPKMIPFILVAHSGAGPLLPAIRQSIPNPVRAYVFVDAGIPRNGATRLDLMKSEDSDWADEFRAYLEGNGRFPNWNSNDLQEIIPDDAVRNQLIAELRPRALDFFTEPIPVFDGWPDAPCAYVLFSSPYERTAAEARQRGWPTYELWAGHFHMLVDPQAVTTLILDATETGA
jgi:hypothetical protein